MIEKGGRISARLFILIAESGTNLQAILDTVEQGEIDASASLVVSSCKAAYVLGLV